MKKIFFILYLFTVLFLIPNKITPQNTEEIWSSEFSPYIEKSKFVDMKITKDGNLFVVGFIPNQSQGYPTRFHGIFYNKDGRLIESIGNGNKGILDFQTELDLSQYSAIDLENNIILGRTYKYSYTGKVTRFNRTVNQSGEEYFEQNLLIETKMIIKGLKVDSDRNIIVVGESKDTLGNKKNVIAKYRADGLPDSNFGNNGTVEVNDLVSIEALTISKENDIIIAVTPLSSNSRTESYSLIKYNSLGKLDTNFAEQGIFNGKFWRVKITKLETNNNGDIVAIGYTNWYPQSKYDFMPTTFIAIVDSNGNKKFSRQFLASYHNKPSALSLNNNGEIAFTLYTNAVNTHFNTGWGYSNNYLFRLSSNGAVIDSTVLPFLSYGNIIQKIIYNNDGSVLLGGTSGSKGGEVITLLRIDATGKFDNQFGNNGILYTSLMKSFIKPHLQDISIDKENNIFLLDNKKVLKINSNGKLDNSFNYDGVLATGLQINSIETTNAGEVICSAPLRMWQEYDYSVLFKIKKNGHYINDFGSKTGITKIAYYRNGPTHKIRDIILNNNADVISLLGGEREYPYVRKILFNGLPDSNFKVKNDSRYLENVNSIALDSDGKILYCGKKFSANSDSGQIIIHRRNSDGSIDNTFNGTGYSNYFDSEGYTVAADLQNRVLVSTIFDSHISIIRLNYSGTIDSTFGNNGILQTPFIQTSASKKNFTVDKNGRIIVIGKIQNNGYNEMALVRYNEDSSIDTTFGTDGILTNNLGIDNTGLFISLDNEENIIAAGITNNKIVINKYKNSDVVSIKDNDNKAPKDFSLSQNYPNPFNPTTTIKYSLPVVATHELPLQNVTLKIYDVLGKEVATLVNEKKSAGNYKITFDGSNLTSGIYFYSLTSGNFRQTKKLILLK